MRHDDEQSIAGFALAETARKEQNISLQEITTEEIGTPLISRWWIIVVFAFLGLCSYFISIDVLLFFWGKTVVGTASRDGGYEYIGFHGIAIGGSFHRIYYSFNDNGKKYEAFYNYPCRRGCVETRAIVTVKYVSWDPDINKTYYDPYVAAEVPVLR